MSSYFVCYYFATVLEGVGSERRADIAEPEPEPDGARSTDRFTVYAHGTTEHYSVQFSSVQLLHKQQTT